MRQGPGSRKSQDEKRKYCIEHLDAISLEDLPAHSSINWENTHTHR